jgi:hypothetical protein
MRLVLARLLAFSFNRIPVRPLKMVSIQHIKAKPYLVVLQALLLAEIKQPQCTPRKPFVSIR